MGGRTILVHCVRSAPSEDWQKMSHRTLRRLGRPIADIPAPILPQLGPDVPDP
jgi:hypothetical protein